MRHRNHCDNLRLLAAVIVVVSHAFMLCEGSNVHEPLFRVSGGQVTAGGLSVCVFFIVSGYLITRSFQHRHSLGAFLAARVLRVLPALAVVLVLTGFVAGPVLSVLPAREYFRAAEPFIYVARNLSLTGYIDRLPGVLHDVPFPDVINGSLWTLHIEAMCYLLVALLGVLGLLNRAVLCGLTVAGLVALMGMESVNYPIALMTHFTAGAALSQMRLRRSPSAMAGCVAVLAVCLVQGGFLIASATLGAYLVISFAVEPSAGSRPLTGNSDLSYGIYIWAFPVQQVLIQRLGPGIGWPMVAGAALPVVLVLALLSWHLIEKRALGWTRSGMARLASGNDPADTDPGIGPFASTQ